MRSLEELLAVLKVDDAAKAYVDQLAAVGRSHDQAVASRTAWGRAGKWVARAGGVQTTISSAEAQLLIDNGGAEGVRL